jgi:hypothetical protein
MFENGIRLWHWRGGYFGISLVLSFKISRPYRVWLATQLHLEPLARAKQAAGSET